MSVPSSSPIQGVLFDYGVVLSGPPDPAAWARLREITGLPEAEFRAAYWTPRHDYDRGVHTGAEYWGEVASHAGRNWCAEVVAELLATDNLLWTQVNQPMVDFALRLQAAGTPTGILSNLGDAMTDGVLARQAWLGGFRMIIWSHSLKLAKPDPEIYRHAIDGMGIPAKGILFIDDREDNVLAARAAGMQAIHYNTQSEFEAEMAVRGLGGLWQCGRLSAQ